MTSSINPNVPASDAALVSAPIRANFAAAYNDINALQISTGGGVNVKSYGATGNGVTNDTAALLAAIAAGFEQGLPVYAPSGKYLFDQQLLFFYDYASLTSVARCGLIGDGPGLTQFLWDGGSSADAAIKFQGDTSSQLNWNDLTPIKDFSIVANSGSTKDTTGLYLDFREFARVERVYVVAMDVGIKLKDVILSTFEDCVTNFGNIGLQTIAGSVSSCNGLTFINCNSVSNAAAGLMLLNGTYTIVGGEIGGNGTTLGVAGEGGIVYTYTSATALGAQWCPLNVSGVYFEANTGLADVNCTQDDPSFARVYTFQGCNFNRITPFATNSIAVTINGNGDAYLTVTGSVFAYSAGQYTPSAARPNLKRTAASSGSGRLIPNYPAGTKYESATEAPGFHVWMTSDAEMMLGAYGQAGLEILGAVDSVNWLGARATATGGTPRIEAISTTDTHVSLGFRAQGAAGFLDMSFNPVKLKSYTVDTLPSASTFAQCIIYVSDGTGNKRLAIADGTNWRFPDGNVVT